MILFGQSPTGTIYLQTRNTSEGWCRIRIHTATHSFTNRGSYSQEQILTGLEINTPRQQVELRSATTTTITTCLGK